MKSIFRIILKPLLKLRFSYIKKRKIKYFQKHGAEALEKIVCLLSSKEYVFWLEFGTLLGAIRNQGFIPHDDDIDLCVPDNQNVDELINLLVRYGFVLKRRIFLISTINSGYMCNQELTVTWKDVPVDIFICSYDEKKSQITTYDFRNSLSLDDFVVFKTVREIKLPLDGVVQMSLYGINVPIPKNYDEHLKSLYGISYMTPNKKWSQKDQGQTCVFPNAIGMIFKN